MNQPDFVRPGEPIKASNMNAIVSAVRSRSRAPVPDAGTVGRRSHPFDVIDVHKDGATWLLRLQPGFFIDGPTASAVKVMDATSEELVPLTDFPDVEVESTTAEPKNLYFSFSERALVWKTPEEATGDLLIILTVTESEDASGLRFANHHPAPIYAKPVVPFAVTVKKDGEGYIANVAPGYFRVKNPSTGIGLENPITDWMPIMGSTPLNETVGDPALPPSLGVTSGDFIYLHFWTDRHGILEEAPKVEVSTGEQSTHYQPDEDNGVDGEYWLRIASVTITDGSVEVNQYQHGGPIEFVPNLWNYKQVGGGKKIIRHRDHENDEWVFRTIKEKSDPQIRVTQETEYIEIKGNSYANTVTDARKVSISVADGLVTALNYTDVTDPTGANLDLSIRHWYFPGDGAPTGGSVVATHSWRNGLYKGNAWTDPDGGPPDLITEEVASIAAGG